MENNLYKLILKELSNQLDGIAIIRPETKIQEDLGLPSIKFVFFLTSITQKLNISIMDFADYELLKIKTVDDIYLLLSNKLNS